MTERKMTMRLDWRALCHISIIVCESGRTYALKMHPAATGGVLGRRSGANRSRVVGRQRNQLTRRPGVAAGVDPPLLLWVVGAVRSRAPVAGGS